MAADFIPSRDANLVNWSLNLKTRLIATPLAFGISAPQAVNYGTLNDSFVALYTAAGNAGTRTPSGVLAKSQARRVLTDNARMLSRIIQATPFVTAVQKSDLGLTVPVMPTPVPVPGTAPTLDIISAVGRTVKIRLHDAAAPTRRGKPPLVSGASVFSFIGTAAPSEQAQWKFEGNITRTVFNVVFPATVAAGAQVWLTAFWYNPRAQQGPGCPAVGTNLPGGSAMAA